MDKDQHNILGPDRHGKRELPIKEIHRPTSMTDLGHERMTARLASVFNEHGDPLRAYLMLEDVDASEPTLVNDFHANYVGCYSSAEQVVENLTEVQDWERDLLEWASERGLEGMVSLDRDEIKKMTRETWDIVELGDYLYVFNR